MADRTKRRNTTDALLRGWGVIVFIFLFLPIAVIVIYSFNNGRLLASFDEFGTDAYFSGLSNNVIIASVLTSLKAAAGTAVLATVLGTCGGIALARAKKGSKWPIVLTALLAITLVTPEIVDGISMLPWFVTLGVDGGMGMFNNGLFRLVVAHTAFSTAIVTFIIRARMAGIDRSLEEAAEDLGATKWRSFRDVTLPLAGPGIFAGALMAFTLSLDNTILSSFVQQPGYTPWPVYIFSAVRVALRPEVAAVSVVMLALTLLALLSVGMVLKKSGNSSSEIVKTMAGS